ncbi:MAG TPA: thiamine pyrophosphate-dependent enzyme [Candidatus Krumholzibacterium sp.]|nr:thiamine pyrophosphate-dependent enzyme [Candidatus Krumholzibacterium sp.]
MKTEDQGPEKTEIAWCPGCGDFAIRSILKRVLSELEIKPEELVLVSGIGQAAKLPQYMRCNYFNGLHGRSLPVATAVKMANPGLKVIAVSGDGCMYGEGGNHFIHAMRRGADITQIVHDNMVYGLTKGQASPTSRKGFKTPVQVAGVLLEPLNPVAMGVSLDATFVARAYCGHVDQTVEILKRAITHRGFSLVDILQPCVSFNRLNDRDWFEANTEYLEEDYVPDSRENAFARAVEEEKLLLGVFYEREVEESFEELVRQGGSMKPLYGHEVDKAALDGLIDSMRV